jgi:hypothetical protein
VIIYLAGGITGNLIKEWQNFMKIYLASIAPELGKGGQLINHYNNDMKLFLVSGFQNETKLKKQKGFSEIKLNTLFILESYHYITKQEWMFPLFKEFKGFLLDSGAFTFMTSMKGQKVNWEQYVINYGNFVKQHNIKHFFELDIDPIVGLKEVERLRNLLEQTAQRKCIPVWHKSRGLEYWKQMVKEYNYVAIGGIVTQEIKRSEYDVFLPLLKIARENNCKVHGLGFTNLKGMEKYKFYSVDSTSWLSGNKFGAVYLFDGKTMQKQNKQLGQRVKTNEVAIHNFSEWVKFSKYAENNL